MKLVLNDSFQEKQCEHAKCSVWEWAMGWTEDSMPQQRGIDEKFFLKEPFGYHKKNKAISESRTQLN